jgi:aspartate/methionine/tyrosine aminotransferase
MDIIKNFERIGEENAFAVLARANALAAEGKDVINLGIGQPDFPTPENIVEAAVKALRDGKHGYTATEGIPELREAVATSLSTRYDTTVNSKNVMVMPGGKVTMYAAISLFGQAGVDILYPDPGFPIYKSMIDYTGANAIATPIRESNAFGFSADEVLSLITDKTRLVILNSPANPTGGVTPKSEIDRLVAGLAERPDIAILSDEIYDQLLYDGEQHTSLLSYPEIREQLIVLNGWSKTYAMTGWRLGYSIWPDSLFDSVRKLAVNAWSCVNAPSQYAALEAITGPQDAVDNMVKVFDERRIATVDALNTLPSVSCVVPKGAFYAFPNITQTGWQAKKLASALLNDTGVAIIGGPDFGDLGEGYLRVSYANSTENILEAINRMKTFLTNQAPPG